MKVFIFSRVVLYPLDNLSAQIYNFCLFVDWDRVSLLTLAVLDSILRPGWPWTFRDPRAFASWSVGIIGMYHCSRLRSTLINTLEYFNSFSNSWVFHFLTFGGINLLCAHTFVCVCEWVDIHHGKNKCQKQAQSVTWKIKQPFEVMITFINFEIKGCMHTLLCFTSEWLHKCWF